MQERVELAGEPALPRAADVVHQLVQQDEDGLRLRQHLVDDVATRSRERLLVFLDESEALDAPELERNLSPRGLPVRRTIIAATTRD